MEGSFAGYDLADKDAKRPDVSLKARTNTPKDFRCDVVRRATVRERPKLILLDVSRTEAFGKAKVNELAVALIVDHYMLGLEIPVHYLVTVQMLYRAQNFG